MQPSDPHSEHDHSCGGHAHAANTQNDAPHDHRDRAQLLHDAGVVVSEQESLQGTLAAVWLASCAHNHLWSWPYRTGESLENVFHVHFTDQPSPAVRTFITVNADWLGLLGAHATPVRTLRLSDEAANEWIDTVLRAMAEKSVRAWTWFGDWWVAFRTQHSELHAAPALGTPPT